MVPTIKVQLKWVVVKITMPLLEETYGSVQKDGEQRLELFKNFNFFIVVTDDDVFGFDHLTHSSIVKDITFRMLMKYLGQVLLDN